MRLLDDSYPVPSDDSASVMICMHRDPWVSRCEWRDGWVNWSPWDDCPRGDEQCRHHALKLRIARVVSAHTVDAW